MQQPLEPTLNGVFPCPVYCAKRGVDLSRAEIKEIKEITGAGMMRFGEQNIAIGEGYLSPLKSTNTHIFDDGLKELKRFCEHHIKLYVEKVITPREELDVYFTQSWLNIIQPGESHHEHSHANSFVSGVFYVSTVEDDKITFGDPNVKVRGALKISKSEYHVWNSPSWYFPVVNGDLVLFPSWLSHKVERNEKATTDRISISFNTFVKGSLGSVETFSELILG